MPEASDEQRAYWREAKQRQRDREAGETQAPDVAGSEPQGPSTEEVLQKEREGNAAPPPEPKKRGRPRKSAPTPAVTDARVIERAARIFRVLEEKTGHAVAAAGLAVVAKSYPEYPITPGEAQTTVEAADLWAEIRCKDLTEWLMRHPLVLRFLPEIVLGGAFLFLVVPRSYQRVLDKAGPGPQGDRPKPSGNGQDHPSA